ncbi:methyltransferase [Streptomyces sp. NBC_01433]|uniref:methyltransferase n=1 Tax=Streptomyces sp. NBC_01433 TaxID=2903864 RepID=UPI00225BB4E2|nr:methyltransferase [Streptomyces sp. NBC_01433]MCX4681839.1 methyltransferase [Streptomyces sp. NBC_01433]
MAHLATPMAIRVAATLRIADHLAGSPRTAAELAGLADADAGALDRVLRHLAARGVLERDGSGRYTLTAVGEPLRSGHPAGLHAMLDIEGAVGRAELSFVQLLHSVRTGEAAFPVQFGRSFWQDLAEDPARGASFDARMGADLAAARGDDIVSGYDWGSLGHVVDVGGGNGSLLIALLNGHPALHGTVLDLPDTAEVARKALAAAGLADRGDAVPGSFFDQLPPGAGGYLLSSVIHDWGDREAQAILRRCAEAAGAGGKVFIVERIGADGESPGTGMDLRMLAYYGGRERGAAELTALAAEAGLTQLAVHPAGILSIVELATR